MPCGRSQYELANPDIIIQQNGVPTWTAFVAHKTSLILKKPLLTINQSLHHCRDRLIIFNHQSLKHVKS